MKLEVGKYYRYMGTCGGVYWSKEMEMVLDRKPRKCTYCEPVRYALLGDFEANFEGIPIPPICNVCQAGWRWDEDDIFEEVQMEPIVGKRYWVNDISEERCIKYKCVSTYLCKTSRGKFVFENETGCVSTWNYFVPVPDDTYEIVHKKDGKEIGRASLTEEQLKVLGIS